MNYQEWIILMVDKMDGKWAKKSKFSTDICRRSLTCI